LFSLQGRQVSLDSIVFVEHSLDVVIGRLQVLLKDIDQFTQGTVGPVSNFVPLERAQVVIGWL